MSVHFIPPHATRTLSLARHSVNPGEQRQPRRDPTWVAIVAFAFLAIILLFWNATADGTQFDAATLQALESGAVVEAGNAPDGTILWAKMIDGEIIYFPSATVART
jgi:hypothetical protein